MRNTAACTMIFDPDLYVYLPDVNNDLYSCTALSGFWASLSAWLPLIYDTIVIALTLHKCVGPVKNKTAGHIMRTLVTDGLSYYRFVSMFPNNMKPFLMTVLLYILGIGSYTALFSLP